MSEHTYLKTGVELPVYMMYPRFLLETRLSETARLVYVLLLDRARLSLQNGWEDEQGAYVYFTVEELQATTRRSHGTITYALRDLSQLDLIRRTKQGKMSPNRIYVKFPNAVQLKSKSGGSKFDLTSEDSSNPDLMTVQNLTGDSPNIDAVTVQNLDPNKNYQIKTTQQEPVSKAAADAAGKGREGIVSEGQGQDQGQGQMPSSIPLVKPEGVDPLDWDRAVTRQLVEEKARQMHQLGLPYEIPAIIQKWPTLDQVGTPWEKLQVLELEQAGQKGRKRPQGRG